MTERSKRHDWTSPPGRYIGCTHTGCRKKANPTVTVRDYSGGLALALGRPQARRQASAAVPASRRSGYEFALAVDRKRQEHERVGVEALVHKSR